MASDESVIVGVRQKGETAVRFVRWTGTVLPELGGEILLDDRHNSSAMVVVPSDRLHGAKDGLEALSSSRTDMHSPSTLAFESVESRRYDDLRGRFPRLGAQIMTRSGMGTVQSVNFRKETLDVLLHDTGETMTVTVEGVE